MLFIVINGVFAFLFFLKSATDFKYLSIHN